MATLSPSKPTTQGLIYSSDYTIKTLTIITSDGVAVDIKRMAVETNLYEDLFSPYMSGSILMGDALDLIALFKLQGNEFLVMEIDKPGLNEPIKKVFRIYKISDRTIGVTLQNYMLHFCSEEAILSTQKLVSKSYHGMIITAMIQDLLVNQLQTSKTKINIIDTTQGIFNYIIPRMNPFEAIEWLATRSYSSNGTLFLFFENKDGFNFRSYENLIAQPVYQTYYQRPKTSINPVHTVNSFNYLKIIHDFDILESGRYGAYAGSLLLYDFVNHKFTGYLSDYSHYNIMNDSMPVNNFQNRFGNTLLGSYDSFFKFAPTVDSDPTVNPQQQQNWLAKKAMRLAQLHSFKMVITIPCDVLMKVGTIINCEIPMALPQTKTPQINSLRTGKYLVSAVHHVFINDVGSTVCELLSDSVSGILNQAQNSTQGIQAVRAS